MSDTKDETQEPEEQEQAQAEDTAEEETAAPEEEAASPEEETPVEEAPAENVAAAEEPVKEEKAPKEKKPKEKTPREERRKWPWVVGVLVVLFVIAFIPFYYTNSAASCGKCHSMTPYYTSWQKSWHGKNDTQCDQCHVRPGAFAYYTYRIGFYRELYAEMFGLKLAPWGATTPGESSCTRDNCHSVNRLSSTSGDIKVNHEVHVKAIEKKYNKACSYCHAGASHAGIKGLGSQLPPRQQCFNCHKDKATNCDYCHTTKFKPGTVGKPHI
jgi:nitrate/TMAO reductase-like tetraheme cytochrome c subunit